MALLSYVDLNPDKKPLGSVIWLHGLGASGQDFVSFIPELRLPNECPLRFVFPDAPLRPVTINNGYVMPAWYDIRSLEIEQRADEHGVNESVSQIHELIAQEIALGIPAEKIMLAGFSQGAVISLITGLTYPKKLAGILFLSGYFPFPEKIFSKASMENRDTPIFMAHGTKDNIVSYSLAQTAYELLQKNHYNAELHTYSMAHTVCLDEAQDISRWLQTIYS